jgi:hypothetical protein
MMLLQYSRRPTGLTASLLASLMWLNLAGCDFGVISTYDLPAAAAATLTLTLQAEDAPAAEALGWPGGRLPAAAMTLVPVDPEVTWSWQGTSGADGTVQVPDIPAGAYRLIVRRLLSEAERAVLQQRGTTAFAAELEIIASPQLPTLQLTIPASERRSLVISEFYYHPLTSATGIGLYNFPGFIEVYNNSDTTIFLDGKTVGKGYDLHSGRGTGATCAMLADRDGIWSYAFERFPGTGRQYPLHPGQAAVIATDAIDHRPFVFQGRALDLSNADFEFIDEGDPDNPAVPNMINIGPNRMPFGHGLFWQGRGSPFIAEYVDPALLPRMAEPGTGFSHARIPADRVLDQMVASYDRDLCVEISAPNFNRGWVQLLGGTDYDLSLQRRPLFTLLDGRVVLQHTRTSSADFAPMQVSPGTVPRP